MTTETSHPIDERPAYDRLAAIYDHVMRHVDYSEWARYLESVFKRHQAVPKTVVDLACGTGNVTMQLHKLGYSMSGVDRSAAMILVAQAKSDAQGRPRFSCGDLRQLDAVGSFDAAVCLYDSFNYLTTFTDIDLALAQVSSVLEPGGMFIFDVCTERNSLLHFQDVLESEEGPGFVYSRHSYYDKQQKMQFNSFEIRFEGEESAVSETHAQRIYAHEEIRERIAASDLELLDAYDGFSFSNGSDDSDRVHFILRKAE
jgi:ubiquinone/menaquinone biosynthesis C-methylase UbiE